MSRTNPDESREADLAALQQGEPLPPLPHKRGEPVFRDSWEAEAYAIGNLLVKDGRLSRAAWMELMAAAIGSARQSTGLPSLASARLWCGTLMPIWRNAATTRPEQSKTFGPSPPVP